jgi:hypothetical protein
MVDKETRRKDRREKGIGDKVIRQPGEMIEAMVKLQNALQPELSKIS